MLKSVRCVSLGKGENDSYIFINEEREGEIKLDSTNVFLTSPLYNPLSLKLYSYYILLLLKHSDISICPFLT